MPRPPRAGAIGPPLFLLLLLLVLPAAVVPSGKRCPLPPALANSRIKLSEDPPSPGAVASYSCDEGYHLFGKQTLECREDGRWTDPPPACATNVALRKPCNQSSAARGGEARKANDGNLVNVDESGGCSQTLKEPSPWWSVDLLRSYPVSVVRITSAGCCGSDPLRDLEVRVGNSSVFQNNPLCSWHPGHVDEGVTKDLPCARPLVGRFVSLQMVGAESRLSLCEVQVFTTEEFSTSQCRQNVELVNVFDRMCYAFHTRGASFQEADERCRDLGGLLLQPLSAATNRFILSELERLPAKFPASMFWIGAKREPQFHSRTWRWLDGDIVSKPAWGKDQPNNYNGEQNCVVLDGARGWLWNDVGCHLDYLFFVCQYRPKTCGSPDLNVNTTLRTYSSAVGASVLYECPQDHAVLGDASRTCQTNALWSGSAPSCKYVNCGPPTSIDDGEVTLPEGRTTFNATAVYTCRANYSLTGVPVQRCQENALWSGGQEQPQCLLSWCPKLEAPRNGSVTQTGLQVGASASFSCRPGHRLSGSSSLKCQLGGRWEGRFPRCDFVDCGPPNELENGHRALVNGTTTYMSLVSNSCDEDFWLEGPSVQTCRKDGFWSGESPQCHLIACDEPDMLPGSYFIAYDFLVHSVIEYHCELGHLMVGDGYRTCQKDGTWSGSAPICRYVDCGRLAPLPKGSLIYTNHSTSLHSQISYECNTGYRLRGLVTRVCTEAGTWSGGTPKCEEIRCGEPVHPKNSIISVVGNDRARNILRARSNVTGGAASHNTYRVGSSLAYRCEKGYKLKGAAAAVVCNADGQWNGSFPICTYVDCGPPKTIPPSTVDLKDAATHLGSMATYSCPENHVLVGHSSRVCLDNFTWSGEPPQCKEIRCGDPETSHPGAKVTVLSHKVNGVSHYSCPAGQEVVGSSTRKCLNNGTWSDFPPACKWVECPHPAKIPNGRVLMLNASLTYQSVIEYHCFPTHVRKGPFRRVCLEEGNWSEHEPRCVEVANLTDALLVPVSGAGGVAAATVGGTEGGTDLGLGVGIGTGLSFLVVAVAVAGCLKLRRNGLTGDARKKGGGGRPGPQDVTSLNKEAFPSADAGYLDGGQHIYDYVSTESPYHEPYENVIDLSSLDRSRRPSGSGGGGETVTVNGVAVNR